jgi:hypothetical protein
MRNLVSKWSIKCVVDGKGSHEYSTCVVALVSTVEIDAGSSELPQ